jgi:hypothetical protein
MKKFLFPLFLCIQCFASDFSADVTWLYLKSFATDGDLQTGTLLTLTDDPANLTAHVQDVHPDFENAFRVNLGACNFNLNYLYFRSSKRRNIDQIEENQFFQNFLGGSFFTSNASQKQQIDQVNLTYGVKCNSFLRPSVGLSFANIHRDLRVLYTLPTPAILEGTLKSKYWGVGPIIGADLQFDLLRCLKLSGHLGTGVLFGKVNSSTDSKSFRQNREESFFSKNGYNRASGLLNGALELTYSLPIYNCALLQLSAGYEVDYYFRAVDRINPNDGYFNNRSTFPVKTSSNIGLGGPSIRLSISNAAYCPGKSFCFEPLVYERFTNLFLTPCPTNDDLVFAVLNPEDKKQRVSPNLAWSGSYDMGCQNRSGLDLRASYTFLRSSHVYELVAEENQNISSVNASGPSFVVFQKAASQARYRLDQGDLILANVAECFGLNPFAGVRYTYLKRKINDFFLNGSPPLTTRNKFVTLKSRFWGAGPLLGCEPHLSLTNCLSLKGRVNAGLLAGQIRSSVDQVNEGFLAPSSNTLRRERIFAIAPVVDVKGAVRYSWRLGNCLNMGVEVGYQFTDYFRAVDLVFPVFLTGLNQRASDIKFSGPYMSIEINNF